MNGGYTNGNKGDYATARPAYNDNKGSFGRDPQPGRHGRPSGRGNGPNRPSDQPTMRSERRIANGQSNEGQWDPSRSRSRQDSGMAAKQIEGQQEALWENKRPWTASVLPLPRCCVMTELTFLLQDVLHDITRDWNFMTGGICVPAQVALQLLDESSLGLARRYDEFQDTQLQLQNALRAIVNGV